MKLNPENKLIGRRNFLKAAAALPAVGVVGYQAMQVGPVKAGIVGMGMEGRILIECMNPKYMTLVAGCDIRPDNQALGAKKIRLAGHAEAPRTYTRYEDLLGDPEIEAVVIATPLHQHGPMAIQALNAGKHVFVEKTMAYSVEDCMEMIRLAKEKGLTLQVGHQRFYNPLYWDAYKMLKEGLLGNVYHIRALWHRNTDWNYWTHAMKEATPELQKQLLQMNTTPYNYPDVHHLVNWRWYQEYSHGPWTELATHQIAITNWLFESMPTAVYAHGGKYKAFEDQESLYQSLQAEYEVKKKYNDTTARDFDEYRQSMMIYKQDDRTICDHIYAIFEYPGNRTVTYSSVQSSSVDQYYEEVMGTRGTIVLSNENESYLFWEPGWDEEKSKKANEEEVKGTQVDVVAEEETQSAFAAHVSSEATAGKGGASDMDQLAPYRWQLQGFAHSIRNGAPCLCDGVQGAKAAIPCLYAEKSVQSQTRVEIPSLTLA